MAKKTVKKVKKPAKAKKVVSKAKKKPAAAKKKMANKAVKKVTKKVAKKVTKKKVSARKKKVSFLPKGYTCITPYLIVADAAAAIEFYKKIFGAKEAMRMQHPAGKIAHAELKFGDAKIMLADEYPDMGARGPQTFGGSPVGIHLYIKDVDAVVERAVKAGAKLSRPVQTMFYGDRCGAVEDPFGHVWYVSTHVEDVTPAQVKKRAGEMFGK